MLCAEHKVLQCKSHTHKNNGREFKASYKNNFKTHYNCSFLEIKQTKEGGKESIWSLASKRVCHKKIKENYKFGSELANTIKW